MNYSNVTINKEFFDSTFPLLDKFREIAPGSYKHCQNVANICETIASELDLNVDLLKCSSLYHDIGKINNPSYFSENQLDSNNIHDNIDRYMSYNIITRHVGDGILHLLKIKDMPHEVIQIISQHHGTTIVQAFYDEGDPEDKFRYKCAKPESDESLILMIVDSVEATSRAFFNSSEFKKENTKDLILKIVEGTIKRLTHDRQLDCMKIGTLNTTEKLLIQELESIYHKRVLYKDENEKTIGQAINGKIK